MTAHHRRLSLPEPPRSTIPVNIPDLTRHELDLFDAGYASGYTAGLQAGLDRGGYTAGVLAGWKRRVEQEYAAWRVMADSVRTMSGILPFAERQARLIAPPANYRPMPTYDQALASWDDTGTGRRHTS